MPRAYSGAVGVGNVGLSSCQPARYAERMKPIWLLRDKTPLTRIYSSESRNSKDNGGGSTLHEYVFGILSELE